MNSEQTITQHVQDYVLKNYGNKQLLGYEYLILVLIKTVSMYVNNEVITRNNVKDLHRQLVKEHAIEPVQYQNFHNCLYRYFLAEGKNQSVIANIREESLKITQTITEGEF